MTTGIILQSFEENMVKRNDPYWVYLKISEDPSWIFKPWLHRDTMTHKIKHIDFLFEGYTSDLIAEKDNKKKPRKKQKRLKKKVKKHKKKADGTTSSGRHPRSTQDVVSKEWYP